MEIPVGRDTWIEYRNSDDCLITFAPFRCSFVFLRGGSRMEEGGYLEIFLVLFFSFSFCFVVVHTFVMRGGIDGSGFFEQCL